MDLYLEYDEDLSENTFFNRLQTEHKIILDTAPLENWVICIPRTATIRSEHLTSANFLLSHVLIPNDELPSTHYTSLLGEDIVLVNKCLRNKHGIDSQILFEEVFYTKSLMKYKVWCINIPLLPNANKECGRSLEILVIRNVNDATELIRNETNSNVIFRRIGNACKAFVAGNSRRMKRLPKLRNSTELLYKHCLQNVMLNRRLKEKCQLDVHFYKILKIALETYMMNEIYQYLFDAITVCTLEECEDFNKSIRNLSDAHLSRFSIDRKHNDVLSCMRVELINIEEYTTAVEKLSCLRRALSAASRSKHTNLSVDELIPILVFIIIKSSLTHWTTTLNFIKEFVFTDMTDVSEKGADSFLVTTLEAAIAYIKTITLQTGWPMINDTSILSIQKSKFESPNEFADVLLNLVRSENEQDVLRMLKIDPDIEILSESSDKRFDSKTHLCHPLCDNTNCESKYRTGRPDVNVSNQHGVTAIHMASMIGSTTMLNLVLALDANINSIDENSWSALHYAAARGHQNTLLLLLHAGININARTNDNFTALHLGSLNGHQGCVKAILYHADYMRLNIEVNCQTKIGDTPLHFAAKWGFTEIVEALLESGANVECVNRFGHTALHYAHNTLISNLLQNSFVVIEKTYPVDESVVDSRDIEPFRGYIRDELMHPKMEKRKTCNDKVIVAIRSGDTKLAYHFLGIEPIPPNESDHHPLCICEVCAPSLPIAMADSNANISTSSIVDINEGNIDGVTPLHAAAEIGDVALVKYLLQQGASMNRKTNSNQTVLHMAVSSGNLAVVEVVLHELDEELLNEQDTIDGSTAMHLAIENGNDQFVNLILKHEPNLDIKNNKQQTPLALAVSRMLFNIIKMLEVFTNENGIDRANR